MLDHDIDKAKARRFVLALGTFWALLAVAALFMLLGDAVTSLVATAAAIVPAPFAVAPFLQNIGEKNSRSSPKADIRRIAATVRATGWNPKLVGVVLTTPLVVFLGILVSLAITGGPDFGEDPFDRSAS